jgi:hypothetical protein
VPRDMGEMVVGITGHGNALERRSTWGNAGGGGGQGRAMVKGVAVEGQGRAMVKGVARAGARTVAGVSESRIRVVKWPGLPVLPAMHS